jgi:hypothetical protein
MKLKSIKNPVLKSALALTACTSLTAFAGSAAIESKKVVKPVEDKAWISGTLEAGYDSRYYFRGLWFADNTTWAGLNLSIPIVDNLTLGLGALYTSTVDTPIGVGVSNQLDYSELDLIASLTYDFKAFKLGVVYTSYQFFDTFSGRTDLGSFGLGEYAVKHVNEVGVVASSSFLGANVYAGYYYDFRIGGSYIEAGADYPIKVNDWVSFIPAVKGGYGLDYYSNAHPANGGLAGGVTSGFTHLLVSMSAPISVTKTATVTPYCAWNVSGRARQSNNFQDNEFFGGVKVGISF